MVLNGISAIGNSNILCCVRIMRATPSMYKRFWLSKTQDFKCCVTGKGFSVPFAHCNAAERNGHIYESNKKMFF